MHCIRMQSVATPPHSSLPPTSALSTTFFFFSVTHYKAICASVSPVSKFNGKLYFKVDNSDKIVFAVF